MGQNILKGGRDQNCETIKSKKERKRVLMGLKQGLVRRHCPNSRRGRGILSPFKARRDGGVLPPTTHFLNYI